MSLRGAVIPHCSGKFFSFHFSSTYYLVFAAAVKKVHLPLHVVPISPAAPSAEAGPSRKGLFFVYGAVTSVVVALCLTIIFFIVILAGRGG